MRRRLTFDLLKRSVASAFVVLCGLFAFHAFARSGQSPSSEADIKAAFIYNFAQFIDWPSRAFPSRTAPFTMCTIGDPAEGTLEKTVEGEKLNGRSIVVRRLGPTDSLKGCHLVYVGALEAKRSMEIITAAARNFATDGAPVLTVGDSEDFIELGGIIRFTESDHRVRFEINPEAAQRVSLRINSRLLRLADLARPGQRNGLR
jgi:hypothetical protein